MCLYVCIYVLLLRRWSTPPHQACWTLSNIAAGTVEQIQTVLDSGALPSLVELASSQCLDPAGKPFVLESQLVGLNPKRV